MTIILRFIVFLILFSALFYIIEYQQNAQVFLYSQGSDVVHIRFKEFISHRYIKGKRQETLRAGEVRLTAKPQISLHNHVLIDSFKKFAHIQAERAIIYYPKGSGFSLLYRKNDPNLIKFFGKSKIKYKKNKIFSNYFMYDTKKQQLSSNHETRFFAGRNSIKSQTGFLYQLKTDDYEMYGPILGLIRGD